MGMSMGENISNAFDSILKFFGFLAFICIILTMLIMSAEVVMRYFFNKPLGWSVEISTYLLVYICFMAAPYVLAKNKHVTMDIVYSKLSTNVRAWLDLINSVLIILISSIITWYSFWVSLDLYQSGMLVHGTSEIPKYLLVLVIFISGLLLFLESARRTYRYIIILSKMKNPVQ